MPLPLIGVTTARGENNQKHPRVQILEAYINAVAEAGGVPIMIPLGLSENMLQEILSRIDGILFTGGGDVHPKLYGAKIDPKVDQVDHDRDRVEIFLFRKLLEARKPFLGICRGIQLINVALGGSLYTDILDQHPEALQHHYYPNYPRTYLAHTVTVEPGSILGNILGNPQVEVNSLHHQGIRQLASSLKATAYAPDQIVEGVELPDYPFGLAVQWHPEWLQAHAPMRALFTSFVEAAGE